MHGHFKKECPSYFKSKGKVYATTLSDSDFSNSDSTESCDGEGNYSAFMTIAHLESSEDLNLLVQELGEHSDEESIGIVKSRMLKKTRMQPVFKRIIILFLKNQESMHMWPRRL